MGKYIRIRKIKKEIKNKLPIVLSYFEDKNKRISRDRYKINSIEKGTDIGSRFFRILCEYKINGEDKEKSILLKYYTDIGEGKKIAFSKRPYAWTFEELILNSYRDEKCFVPPAVARPRMLFMEDLGDETLQDKIKSMNKEEKISLLKKTLEESLVDFHVAAETKVFQKLNLTDYSEVTRKRDFLGRAINYYQRLLAFQKENPDLIQKKGKEFIDYFSLIHDHLLNEILQLIHGDMESLHIMIKNGKSYITDLEKAKMGSVCIDLAGILKTPDLGFKDEEIENLLLRPYKQKHIEKQLEARGGIIKKTLIREIKPELTEEAWQSFLKTFHYASIFECLRKSAKLSDFELLYPKKFERFTIRYPEYKIYRDSYLTEVKNELNLLIGNREKYGLDKEEREKIMGLGNLFERDIKTIEKVKKSRNERRLEVLLEKDYIGNLISLIYRKGFNIESYESTPSEGLIKFYAEIRDSKDPKRIEELQKAIQNIKSVKEVKI